MEDAAEKDEMPTGEAVQISDGAPAPQPESAPAHGPPHPDHGGWGRLGEWLHTDPPPRRWLVTDTRSSVETGIPAGIVGLLSAPGGTGKSYALTQLAVSVACGVQWLETFRPVATGKVLLFLAEEGADETHRRLVECAKLVNAYPTPGAAVDQEAMERLHANLVPVPLAGQAVHLVDAKGEPTRHMEDLHAAVERHRPVLVVLDPLVLFGGRDVEKDEHVAARFFAALRDATGANGDGPGCPTVMLAHHATKASRATAKNPGTGDAATARGSGAIVDAVRWLGTLSVADPCGGENESPLVAFRCAKLNAGRPFRSLDLKAAGGEHGGCLVRPESAVRDSATSTTAFDPARYAPGRRGRRERAGSDLPEVGQ